MKIKPNDDYRHANYPSNTALNSEEVYEATHATNQPDWKARGLIFVACPNGAPELLLSSQDYEIVTD